MQCEGEKKYAAWYELVKVVFGWHQQGTFSAQPSSFSCRVGLWLNGGILKPRIVKSAIHALVSSTSPTWKIFHEVHIHYIHWRWNNFRFLFDDFPYLPIAMLVEINSKPQHLFKEVTCANLNHYQNHLLSVQYFNIAWCASVGWRQVTVSWGVMGPAGGDQLDKKLTSWPACIHVCRLHDIAYKIFFAINNNESHKNFLT